MSGSSWKSSRMSESGRETYPDIREWSGCPPGCPAVVGRPSWMSLRGGRPFRMSGSCRVTLPDVREALPVVREWSGDPSECSGVVGKPSQMCGRPFQMSGRPHRCPGSVRKALSDIREALSNVREWLGGPPRSSGGPLECLSVVWRP